MEALARNVLATASTSSPSSSSSFGVGLGASKWVKKHSCFFARFIVYSSLTRKSFLGKVVNGGGRIGRSETIGARAGLVDGLVDELHKLSKSGNRSSNIAEPIQQLSGDKTLYPSHNEALYRGILAITASVSGAAVITPPTPKPVLKDTIRHGRMIENQLVYRQTFVIRSYEVGADKTASIETLMNLFQETALNHVRLSGIEGDGFGTTKAMVRNGLIWVVNRMHVEVVESYPAWSDVVEIDSWVASSGKNGMRRDWLLRSKAGKILARATSTWVMMHQKTRRLAKMPDDVRAEISTYFLDRNAVNNEGSLKISKLQNESAQYVASGLQARRSDLDMNQHVNNVKYIAWMLESVPTKILESLEIKSITLEYRRECGQTDVVESLTSFEETTAPSMDSTGMTQAGLVDPQFPYLSTSASGVSLLSADNQRSLMDEPEQHPQLIHLLKTPEGAAEIVRGRTVWRSKRRSRHFASPHS